MASRTYEHNCFFCIDCLVLINVDLTKDGALPIADGESMQCSVCGDVLKARREESWMRGMCAAQSAPWSEARKDKIRDYMLKNPHPEMSEQAKFRMSMNAFQTGLHSKVHHLPPARPGKYEACALCPFASPRFHEFQEGDSSCETGVKNNTTFYCVRQSKRLAEWINASAFGKTDKIREIIGDLHARMVLIADNAADRVAIDGLTKELVTRKFKDGKVIEESVEDVVMSPHFKALMEICDKLGLKLENFLLTSKSVSDKQIAESTAEHIAAMYGKKPTILDNPDPI